MNGCVRSLPFFSFSSHVNGATITAQMKGIFRDHSRDNALNFHTIRDFCILVMVLEVWMDARPGLRLPGLKSNSMDVTPECSGLSSMSTGANMSPTNRHVHDIAVRDIAIYISDRDGEI